VPLNTATCIIYNNSKLASLTGRQPKGYADAIDSKGPAKSNRETGATFAAIIDAVSGLYIVRPKCIGGLGSAPNPPGGSLQRSLKPTNLLLPIQEESFARSRPSTWKFTVPQDKFLAIRP